MQRFEFQVVPASRRGEKARGARTTEERFALALTRLMNRMGAEGWDYVRTDALPCDERAGLRGVRTTYQNMLVFRRPLGSPEADPAVIPAGFRPGAANGADPPVAGRVGAGAASGPTKGAGPAVAGGGGANGAVPPLATPASAPAVDAGRDARAEDPDGKALPRLRLDTPIASSGVVMPTLGPATSRRD